MVQWVRYHSKTASGFLILNSMIYLILWKIALGASAIQRNGSLNQDIVASHVVEVEDFRLFHTRMSY